MSPVSSSLESQLWQTDSTLVSHEPSSSKADTKPEIIMAYQHSMQFGSDSTISPALKGRIAMFERSGKPKIIINFFCGFAWKWFIQAINTTQYTKKLEHNDHAADTGFLFLIRTHIVCTYCTTKYNKQAWIKFGVWEKPNDARSCVCWEWWHQKSKQEAHSG